MFSNKIANSMKDFIKAFVAVIRICKDFFSTKAGQYVTPVFFLSLKIKLGLSLI